MNNNGFDFDSKKYGILLFIVCFLFFVLIIKAFDYLPDNNVVVSETQVTKTSEKTNNSDTVFNDNEEENSVKENEYEENRTQNKSNKKPTLLYRDETLLNSYRNSSKEPAFDEIDAPKGVNPDIVAPIQKEQNSVSANNSQAEQAGQVIFNAKKLKANGDYSNALKEYQKIPAITDDNEIIASSYEGIAEIYAISRKFGTALSFATKANNLAPSYSREILIAKIYYKAGETDKAINRVNDILKKGFN